MKAINTAAVISATLLLSACGDTESKDAQPQPAKPAALMSSKPVAAPQIEAVPVEQSGIADNIAIESTANSTAQPTRRTPDSHTIGDRREQ